MEQKRYKKTNKTVKCLALLLGVCFLVTPVKVDRLHYTPANSVADALKNNDLQKNELPIK